MSFPTILSWTWTQSLNVGFWGPPGARYGGCSWLSTASLRHFSSNSTSFPHCPLTGPPPSKPTVVDGKTRPSGESARQHFYPKCLQGGKPFKFFSLGPCSYFFRLFPPHFLITLYIIRESISFIWITLVTHCLKDECSHATFFCLETQTILHRETVGNWGDISAKHNWKYTCR